MKKILSMIALFAVTASIAACGGSAGSKTDSATSSDLKTIQDKGELTIGMTLFAPMNYKDDSGELVGFETEFATAVCEKLGVKPKFQEINWDSKEVELNSSNIDCIWNGLTITDERKANMSITKPYMENKQVLVVKKENAAIGADGKNLVAEAGSAGEEVAKADAFFAKSKFTAVDSQAKALMDVEAGTSDMALVDYVASIGSIGEGTDYKDLIVVDGAEFSPEQYGIAFRKESDVTEKVNEIISEMTKDGSLKKIADKYKLGDLLVAE